MLEGKIQAGSVRLETGKPWQFLGKFGFAIGTGRYSLRLRLREPAVDPMQGWARVAFNVFLDEDWGRVETLPDCKRSSEGPARWTHFAGLAPSGEWGPWENGTAHQVVRAHIWYFALHDCRQELGNNSYLIDFELHTRQSDGSEFGVEMRHMLPTNGLALLGLAALVPRYATRCVRLRRSVGSVHPVVLALLGVVGLRCGAQALHTSHLWRLGTDGVGLRGLDVLSEVLLALSQVGQTALLIAIATGYTLLHSRLGGEALELAIPCAALHTVLILAGHLEGQAMHRHHVNEGAIGWALLGIRVLLYLWFVRALRTSQAKGGLRLQAFLQQFQVAGSACFLSYPVLYAVVQLFAPYLRHPILQLGTLVVQTLSDVWLAELFLSRGAYFKASMMSSALLPGGAGALPLGLCKEE